MTLRPLVRDLVRGPLRSPTQRRGGWSPASLFLAGEQGGWWDPSDFSTMFQDSAGTTPVTAVGQPVGLIRDKSGRGNHLLQGTTTSRPLLQQDAGGFFHLLFDGVDDGLATAGNVDFTGTAKVFIATGIVKLSDATQGELLELGGTPATVNGTFGVLAPAGGSTGYFARVFQTTDNARGTSAAFPAPSSNVLSVALDLSTAVQADQLVIRVNASLQALTGGVAASTGSFAALPLFVGRRNAATNPFTGRLYQKVLRGAASSAAQITLTERFCGMKMGIVL